MDFTFHTNGETQNHIHSQFTSDFDFSFFSFFSAQYGNLAIFLQLWFYVKSILADFRWSKTAILTILAVLFLTFWAIFDIFKCGISKKSWFKASKIVEIVVLDLLKSAKIDFT